MKTRVLNKLFFLLIITGLVYITACEKDEIHPTDKQQTDEFYDVMSYYYYWIDSIPNVEPNNYATPDELLEGMRFLPKDKWSYITNKDAFAQYYDEGTYVGYGFGYAVDGEGNIRVTFLFDDSDLNNFGIERGWIIKEINGTSVNEDTDINSLLGSDEIGVTNSMKFESPIGEIVNEEFVKKLVTMNTVSNEMVIDVGSKKVGYFFFKSFIGPSETELNSVFNNFSTANIDELVIDLRYNGGGQINIAEHMAGLIIPDNVNSQLFVKYEHNNNISHKNVSQYFVQSSSSLKLDRVYFIAGKGSASASEVIINSLEPYLDVYVVGDDTYGKPVGMYAIQSAISDLVYVPISFKLVNSEGYGGYYEGLKADSYVTDDVMNNFGEGEAVLEEVLHHIETGSFTSLKSSSDIFRKPVKDIISLKDEIGAI